MIALLILLTYTTFAHGPTPSEPPVAPQPTAPTPLTPAAAVAASYLDALEARDITRADALFVPSATVFETGGDEGGWTAYRDHHLGPELGHVRTFAITRGEPSELASADHSLVVVSWPLEYRVELDDDRVIESRGTMSLAVVEVEGELRIGQLHWSSRRNKRSD